LIQDTNSIRFRDRDHTRLGNLEAEGAPDFPEIALFAVPPEFTLDPTAPWSCSCWRSASSPPGKKRGSPSISATRFRMSI
jgi:transcriptional regulator of nitric oxide reductase